MVCPQPEATNKAGEANPALPRTFIQLDAKNRHNVDCTSHELNALNSRLKNATNDCMVLTEQVWLQYATLQTLDTTLFWSQQMSHEAFSMLVEGVSNSSMHLNKVHAPVCSCLSKDAAHTRECHDYACQLDNSDVCKFGKLNAMHTFCLLLLFLLLFLLLSLLLLLEYFLLLLLFLYCHFALLLSR